MSQYAAGTQTSVLSSQAEVLGILARFGIEKHAFMNDGGSAAVAFEFCGINYRMSIQNPIYDDCKFTPTGRIRSKDQTDSAVAEETKRRWRSLVLLVKAKIVAVNDKISGFEQEFMPYMVSTNGISLYDAMRPSIEQARSLSGNVQLALPGGR